MRRWGRCAKRWLLVDEGLVELRHGGGAFVRRQSSLQEGEAARSSATGLAIIGVAGERDFVVPPDLEASVSALEKAVGLLPSTPTLPTLSQLAA
jgi:DNA-binding GntR family transcriptional regulator